MNKRLMLLTAAAVICLNFAGIIFAAGEKSKKDDLYDQVELFAGAVSLIRDGYVDEVDSKTLVYGALKGMLMSLDSHSQFMDPETYKEVKIETEGKFGGLGIEITLKDGILTIISAIEDTPAFKAGLKPNDRIVRIDNESTRDITLTDAVKRLRGDPGTNVSLTIVREDENKILDFVITRGIIAIKSIKEARILEDKIGYVRLVEFQENTPKDLLKALQALRMKGMNGLILDLRNNPGGLLEISAGVSEIFLPEGQTVVTTKGRLKDQNRAYKAKYKRPYTGFPLVILVNEGSASASEIVTGAIKDNKRGIIVGMRTFGKGSVQTVIPLGDGSALRLTTAKYFTPNGYQIHNNGVKPDVVIPYVKQRVDNENKDNDKKEDAVFEEIEGEKARKGPSEKDGQPKYDNQLETAVNLIKGIKAYESLKAQK